ncbi:MAG TPA: alpha/beta hydrolase [Gemmatimonadaceae bacterium]|nr:alpha/beta hydrolase [Gemmatimonadaceae bacterium]
MNALAITSLFGLAAMPLATTAIRAQKPSIVLIHGAFADASSWNKVIPILESDGYMVTAVQIPLSSLSDDVAATKRVLDAQPGPVVLVGHSWGGAVITTAAAGNKKVKSLVYVAAFAPEAGEVVTGPASKYPAPELNSVLKPDEAGFLYIDRARFRDAFAHDLPESDTRIMAATQKPIYGKSFGETVPAAAWKTIPSWYIVSTEDHAINPDLERYYAKRIGATTTEIKASHVPFLSHPKEVARVIEAAAK